MGRNRCCRSRLPGDQAGRAPSIVAALLLAVVAGPSCGSAPVGGRPDGGEDNDGAAEALPGDASPAEDGGCWVTEAPASTDDVCVFALPAPPNSNTSNDHIYVWADSLRIIQDPTDLDGWDYTDASHRTIEIYGSQCDRIHAGVVQAVWVTYFCYGPA